MEVLQTLYQLKKNALMLENLKEGKNYQQKMFDAFRNEFDLPNRQALHPLFELNGKMYALETIESLILSFMGRLRSEIPDNIFEEWIESDYDVYTDKFHHRKFWNEIPNDNATQFFFELFALTLDVDEKLSSKFIICLYDFNDEDFYFDTKEAAENFANEFGIDTYTLYEKVKNGKVYEYREVYSV